jgi:DNA-binding YbaB/EbfC family protein
MFDGFDMSKMSAMMEKMKSGMKEFEEGARATTLSTKTGGGMLKISANGLGEVIDIEIDDTLLEDKASLQIMLIGAMNDINKMAEDYKKSKAAGLMGAGMFS